MACITCGKSFDSSFMSVVKKKKEQFDKLGTEYYIFRKDETTDWSITKKEYFSEIMATKKPKDYFHISEFKPD